MTEPSAPITPRVSVTACPPEALLRLEFWGAPATPSALPAIGRALSTPIGRLMWIEPGAYLLRAPLAALAQATEGLEVLCGQDGAVIDITGGLARFQIAGPGWRELLTINAVFDVENPQFETGCVAATLLNHAAVWIDVTAPDRADLYCLPSYAEDLAEGWTRAIRRMT